MVETAGTAFLASHLAASIPRVFFTSTMLFDDTSLATMPAAPQGEDIVLLSLKYRNMNIELNIKFKN